MSFFNKIVNESPDNKRTVIFKSVDVNFDTAFIIEYSRETRFTDINPTIDNNCPQAIVTEPFFPSIPTKDSLNKFISWEISKYLNDDVDSQDVKEIHDTILNLIITCIIKNVNLLLTSCKSNDLQVEKEPSQNVENP